MNQSTKIPLTEEQQKEMWKFCPEKRCYWCKKDISKFYYPNGEVITSCYHCNRSFIE